ncbi:MAG: rhomboid family intramembrane serine protease [Chitinophagaceae bacterium]|nr:rhomboid family intramembrane serine protease [Chitinophagaceae bacterium]
MGVLEQTKSRKIFLGADHDPLVRIIVINVLITTILFFIRGVYQISRINIADYQANVVDWLILPAAFNKTIGKPWTLITYMFTHADIWKLIANMLWLWAFGFIMQSMYGGRKLVPLYIYGGIAGSLFFVVTNLLLNGGSGNIPMYGANASVMAIATCITIAVPGYRIFPMLNGGIPLWVLMLIYAVINLTGLGNNDTALYAAQVGGAGMGFLYITLLNRGRDIGGWMNNAYDWFFNLFNPDNQPPKSKVKENIFYDTQGKQPFKKKPNLNQQRIDEILDKINQAGFNSLSSEEKELLRRAGEEDI